MKSVRYLYLDDCTIPSLFLLSYTIYLYKFDIFLDLKGQFRNLVVLYLQNLNFFSPNVFIQKQDKRNSIRHEPKERRKDHRKIDFVELSL